MIEMKETMDYIYKSCSDRVRKRVKESALTHMQIFSSDPKQISWIINNRRTKNNRYLICDAVFYSIDSYTKEEIGLIPTLNFQNRQEILWGNIKERENGSS